MKTGLWIIQSNGDIILERHIPTDLLKSIFFIEKCSTIHLHCTDVKAQIPETDLSKP